MVFQTNLGESSQLERTEGFVFQGQGLSMLRIFGKIQGQGLSMLRIFAKNGAFFGLTIAAVGFVALALCFSGYDIL